MEVIKTKRRTFEDVNVIIIDLNGVPISILHHYARNVEHRDFLYYLRSQGISYRVDD